MTFKEGRKSMLSRQTKTFLAALSLTVIVFCVSILPVFSITWEDADKVATEKQQELQTQAAKYAKKGWVKNFFVSFSGFLFDVASEVSVAKPIFYMAKAGPYIKEYITLNGGQSGSLININTSASSEKKKLSKNEIKASIYAQGSMTIDCIRDITYTLQEADKHLEPTCTEDIAALETSLSSLNDDILTLRQLKDTIRFKLKKMDDEKMQVDSDYMAIINLDTQLDQLAQIDTLTQKFLSEDPRFDGTAQMPLSTAGISSKELKIYDPALQKMNKSFETLKNTVEKNSKTIAALDSDFKTLKTSIDTSSTEITTLSEEVKRLKEALKQRRDSYEGFTVSKLESQLDKVETLLAKAENIAVAEEKLMVIVKNVYPQVNNAAQIYHEETAKIYDSVNAQAEVASPDFKVIYTVVDNLAFNAIEVSKISGDLPIRHKAFLDAFNDYTKENTLNLDEVKQLNKAVLALNNSMSSVSRENMRFLRLFNAINHAEIARALQEFFPQAAMDQL